MKFDCLIIGGGIAGLTCGIRCIKAGLNTALISGGMNALHFSSGSIDLLGFDQKGEIIYNPFESLKELMQTQPSHPYSKCGLENIKASLNFFAQEIKAQGLELSTNEEQNHFHITSLGQLKPTYLSQNSVFNAKIKKDFFKNSKVILMNFKGFRDFYPELIAANLLKNKLFKDCKIKTGLIDLSVFHTILKNPYELRSIDLCRIFDHTEYIDQIAEKIRYLAQDADFIGLPAVLGIYNYQEVHSKLEAKTSCLVYEISTLPPSILGLRLDDLLKKRFIELGGIFIQGHKVTEGEIKNHVLETIYTDQQHTEFKAKFFVLASGSFFSGGLTSQVDQIKEPIFDLKVDYTLKRNTWYAQDFFHQDSHPFLSFGVKTDANLHPLDESDKIIQNLYACGALLSNYNPIKEGSGSGVAISTGFTAANQIIESLK